MEVNDVMRRLVVIVAAALLGVAAAPDPQGLETGWGMRAAQVAPSAR